jgi:WXG100 family type VII secretion target
MADTDGFAVDLAALAHAIDQVSGERDTMHGEIHSLRSTFGNVEDHWKSPAGSTFVGLTTTFNSATDNLMAVLEEAINRMRTAYHNYAATEATNTNNLKGKGSGGSGGSGGGGGGGAQTRLAMRSGAAAPVAGTPGATTPLAMRSGAVAPQP